VPARVAVRRDLVFAFVASTTMRSVAVPRASVVTAVKTCASFRVKTLKREFRNTCSLSDSRAALHAHFRARDTSENPALRVRIGRSSRANSYDATRAAKSV
jgi:hypothetical protein